MRREGLADAIVARAQRGDRVLGICGGCQMLGETIEDPHAVESREPLVKGLGLLPLRTRFEKTKTTARVVARSNTHWFESKGAPEIRGYEIHMGTATPLDAARAAFTIVARNGEDASQPDGAVSSAGNVAGTMLHGIFENESVRGALLDDLRRRRGLQSPRATGANRNAEYARLAETVKASINMQALRNIIGI